MRKWLVLLFSHGFIFVAGFGLGIYLLPILTAPSAPELAILENSAKTAIYKSTFTKDLKGSDFLHWGEGEVSVGESNITHIGELAPGPDYKLYLTQSFVEDEAGFNAIKSKALQVGDIKTFGGFSLDFDSSVDIEKYNTIVIWCESFGEFITATKYR